MVLTFLSGSSELKLSDISFPTPNVGSGNSICPTWSRALVGFCFFVEVMCH